MIKIAVVNESTVIKDADVQACVAALQIQVDRDFTPLWNADAELEFLEKGTPLIAGEWELVILDDSDQADALGYHELTADGAPIGKVFAKSDLDAGTSWTVTASHELLEMLADPDINLCAEVDNPDGSITFYAQEVCDAVEADGLGYQIRVPGGALIAVSDFVTPEWFRTSAAGPYSFQRRALVPFGLAPGGYISILKANSPDGWEQVTADLKPGGPAAPTGSRRARRRIPDVKWRHSRR